MHDLRVWLRWLGQRDCKTVHRSYYEKVSTLTPFGTFLAQVYGYVPNNRTVMGGSLESLESQNVVGAAECNADGSLDILDFVCFQAEWVAQRKAGDCNNDGEYNVLDFVCYQTVFVKRCD